MDPYIQTPSPLPLHLNTVPSIPLKAILPSVYSLVPDIVETLGIFSALFGLSLSLSSPPHLSHSKREPIKQRCNANSESEESAGQVLAAEGMSV